MERRERVFIIIQREGWRKREQRKVGRKRSEREGDRRILTRFPQVHLKETAAEAILVHRTKTGAIKRKQNDHGNGFQRIDKKDQQLGQTVVASVFF